MKRRQWDAKQKARIVLEGLKGRPVSERCTQASRVNQQSSKVGTTGVIGVLS